jgi:hypothetical protein
VWWLSLGACALAGVIIVGTAVAPAYVPPPMIDVSGPAGTPSPTTAEPTPLLTSAPAATTTARPTSARHSTSYRAAHPTVVPAVTTPPPAPASTTTVTETSTTTTTETSTTTETTTVTETTSSSSESLPVDPPVLP